MTEERTIKRETTERGTGLDGTQVTKETVTETKTAPAPAPPAGGTPNVSVTPGSTDAAGAPVKPGATGGSVSINTPEGTQVNVNT